MAGIYSNCGKSGEGTIKAGIGYAEVPGCPVILYPAGQKNRKCRDGMALQKKCQIAIRKKCTNFIA